MDVILVPGFWLNASSWSKATTSLVDSGHHVRPLTLPGLESVDAPRDDIHLSDHIDAVVAEIDATDEVAGPVVLVGHSGGGAIIYGAADARPDRIARCIYVDSLPLGPGGVVNDELPVVGDSVPLPDWNVFDDADLVDLDDELREEFRAQAIPEPRHVPYDQQVLHDERRYNVPATMITCEFPAETIRSLLSQDSPFVRELDRLHDVEYVDLPTGHWPQFTKPAELGVAMLAAVER